MKNFKIGMFFIIVFMGLQAFAELGRGNSETYSYRSSEGIQVEISEKEYRCLEARKSLEEIFSEEADYFNQPVSEVRDAIQAYKKLDCVYTAGFLFTNPRQVDRYFRYMQQGRRGSRMPASIGN